MTEDSRSMTERMQPITEQLVIPLDGSASADRGLLGGKGWSLQRMAQLGIVVPPAFTITTRACHRFYASGHRIPDELWTAVLDQLEVLERQTGAKFGATPPLLVSVRSGAAVSMPGMMDTLLNVGLTPMALDWMRAAGASPTHLAELAERARETFAGADFPVLTATDPDSARAEALAQLRLGIGRIFESWNSQRARTYREAHAIPDTLGTAVTVQVMVLGNRDELSGTGVYVTRDPITGAAVSYGDWLGQAQGDDLVSGLRTPSPLATLSEQQPTVYQQLLAIGQRLEHAYRNVLEIEFTVESGVLYLLQVRHSTGSKEAAVRWAVDLVHEGLIDIPEALSRIPADWLPAEPTDADDTASTVLARGIGVSPGLACGYVVDNAEDVVTLADQKLPVILARPTTSPHDIHGFLAAGAVITERGGSTSHAAVVGRQIGLPCVVGCGAGLVASLAGRLVTVDGSTGVVYAGAVGSRSSLSHERSAQVECLLRWRAETAR